MERRCVLQNSSRLLSEGVCRLLGIIRYHLDVEPWVKKRKEPSIPETGSKKQEDSLYSELGCINDSETCTAPCHYPILSEMAPHQDHHIPALKPLSLGRICTDQVDSDTGNCSLCGADKSSRIYSSGGGWNHSWRGVQSITLVEPLAEEILRPTSEDGDAEACRRVTSDEEVADRQRRLLQIIGKPAILDEQQCQQLHEFLAEQHEAFPLDPGEREETDLLQFEIDTGDATPTIQPPRRMPFVVRQEVARQLKNMQEERVISLSSSR